MKVAKTSPHLGTCSWKYDSWRGIPERDERFQDPQVMYSLCDMACEPSPNMGPAPGGKMEHEIYEDPYDFEDWDQGVSSKCFVHLANSLVWRSITDEEPPTVPFTSKEYTQAGLPWFDFYSEKTTPVDGTDRLKGIKSVTQIWKKKGDNPLPENESVDVQTIISLKKKLAKGQVREGCF